MTPHPLQEGLKISHQHLPSLTVIVANKESIFLAPHLKSSRLGLPSRPPAPLPSPPLQPHRTTLHSWNMSCFHSFIKQRFCWVAPHWLPASRTVSLCLGQLCSSNTKHRMGQTAGGHSIPAEYIFAELNFSCSWESSLETPGKFGVNNKKIGWKRQRWGGSSLLPLNGTI